MLERDEVHVLVYVCLEFRYCEVVMIGRDMVLTESFMLLTVRFRFGHLPYHRAQVMIVVPRISDSVPY